MAWWKIPLFKLSMIVVPTTLVSIFYFDNPIATFVKEKGSADLMETAKVFSHLGQAETYFAIIILGLIVIYASTRTWDRRFLFGLSAMAISGISVQILKAIFARERPNLEAGFPPLNFHILEFHHSVHSFPSGHSQAAFAFLAFVRWKFPTYFIPVAIFASLVAASRVILQAHFLSDVIFGSFFGYVSVYVVMYVWTKREFRKIHTL